MKKKQIQMTRKMIILLVTILVGTLVLDQIVKFVVTSQLSPGESIEVIPGFFSITYVQNTGGAWSLLSSVNMLFFYAVTVVALGLLGWYLTTLRKDQWLSQLGVVLMISGALGNFFDRLLLEYVRDFFEFIIFGYNFPVFNIADICLIVGIGLVIIDEITKGMGFRAK